LADLDLISGLRLVFDDPAVKRRNARTYKTFKNMGSQSFSNFSQKGVAGSGE
jgi:hypothetical protein